MNPCDIDGVAAGIHHALMMDGAERRRQMNRLREHVVQHDVLAWAKSFVAALTGGAKNAG